MTYWLRSWGPPGRPTPRPSCTEILPELVIGEYVLPEDVPWLAREIRVHAVFSLQDDGDLVAKNIPMRQLLQAYELYHIEFSRIPVADGCPDSLLQTLDMAVEVLRQRALRGQRVYLHCNAGINRAPTVAIAYMHVCHGLSLLAARTWVQARRPCVPYWSALECWARSRLG